MTTAINLLLTELTEEEAADLQGGAGFFLNLPSFGGTVNPGGNTNPLNFGFTSLFANWGSAMVSGFAQSTPGSTAPVNPVNLDPTKINAALLQFLFTP